MHPNTHDTIVSVYTDMIDYYLKNMGKASKFGLYRTIITEKLVYNVVQRYNSLVPKIDRIDMEKI